MKTNMCGICGSDNIGIEYHGQLKTNLIPPLTQTDESIDVFFCADCGVFWHKYKTPDNFYQSGEYRQTIENSNEIADYYARHDGGVLKKLQYTGTDIFRDKTVMDVGAGGGSFWDFIKGVAKTTIAVEPNETYRFAMKNRGVEAVFDYPSSALADYRGVIDIITSFDVIEHVEYPQEWINEIYALLKQGGTFICGTPTDYPLLRKFAKETFEPFLFQVVHPWIFSEKSLHVLFKKAGFKNTQIEQKYHYGIGNFINWLQSGTAKGDIRFTEFSETLNEVFRAEMIASGMGEYLLVKAYK
jgi:2-polyprenyl-3-methyl-5-hydroxy-6-metoxy-1,4-benzoquinol methylase